MQRFLKIFPVYCSVFFLFVLPASSNYQLNSFEFGGGGNTGDSANFSMEGIAGQTADNNQKSANYNADSGLVLEQQSNVPPAPTFTNDTGTRYNRLKYILNPANNPSDAVFAIAISTDDFTTTNYIQADNTVGASALFQTYTAWGSGTGNYVIGLDRNTTYKVKAKARQGIFTESPWGPTASAATVDVTLSFDIDVAPTDSSSSPPYEVDLGGMNPGTVTTAPDKIWLSLTTNAESGGFVSIYDSNGGLESATQSYTISAVSNNLSSVSEGYGLQVSSITQSAGGPIAKVAPYDGASNTVGVVDSTFREIITSGNNPVTGGRASLDVKAKASATAPASNDYSDTLTLVATANF